MNISLTNRPQMTILPMASSCSLHAYPGTLFVKILEQMSIVNFMDYFLGTTTEGFVPSASLKDSRHLNILSVNLTKESRNKSQSQDLTPSSWDHACGTRRGDWGHASILSVMPNVAPQSNIKFYISNTTLIHHSMAIFIHVFCILGAAVIFCIS